MPDEKTLNQSPGDQAKSERVLTPEAQRALAEAAERRRLQSEHDKAAPKPREVGGQVGPDPVRYGDWEKGGIISDF